MDTNMAMFRHADMAGVVPYTVSWQVKQRLGDKEGSTPWI